MQISSEKQKTNRTDRALIILSLLSVLFFSAILTNDQFYDYLFDKLDSGNKTLFVAQVFNFKKDIRYKSGNSLNWKKVSNQQLIYLGDSIFTGEKSSTQISLADGGKIELSENTLVKFSLLDGYQIPEIIEGKIKITGQESVKAMVDGKLIELSGNGAEYQISVDQHQRTQLRAINALAQSHLNQVNLKSLSSSKKDITKVFPKKNISEYSYTEKLYDLYDRTEQGLRLREFRRSQVEQAVELTWETLGPENKIYGEYYAGSTTTPTSKFESTGISHTLQTVSLGDNFWRLSSDQKNWSKNMHFKVIANPLQESAPQLKIQQAQVLVTDEVSLFKHEILSENSELVFILESSRDLTFSPISTKVYFTSSRVIPVKFNSPGIYYYRLRGMNKRTELTAYSATSTVTVLRPQTPPSPKLTKNEIHIYLNQTATLSWQKNPLARKYSLVIADERGKPILQETQEHNTLLWTGKKIGVYSAAVYSVDQWNRKSTRPSVAKIFVEPDLKPMLTKKHVEEKKEERKPAQQTSTTQIKQDDRYMNENYPSSRLDLEGSAFAMYSTEQVAQRSGSPIALMMGARVHHWWSSHGAEALVRTKFTGLNSASSQVTPLQAEARYLYRWMMPWNVFSDKGGSQVALIAGYETYRNTGSTQFSPQFDLFKTGFGLEFPLLKRWDTGGEVLYGQGADNSKKYEINGHIDYYIKRNWSMGAGYRIHLFDAGSAASSPLGLPYREGYGEGYSILRWHY